MMQQVLFWILMAVCAASSAATMYISDELTVPLRRGPTNGHKIIHAGLPSGTPLEVLGEDKANGFTQVRTVNGTDGWVPTQYLTSQPAARDQLAAANKRVQALEAQLKATREEFKETRTAQSQAESRNSQLDKQARQLQMELDEVRRVSATSLAQYEENKQLKVQNQQLNAQVTDLTSRVNQLQRRTMIYSLLSGGGLVLLGLILGAWIKSRPRRSSWA